MRSISRLERRGASDALGPREAAPVPEAGHRSVHGRLLPVASRDRHIYADEKTGAISAPPPQIGFI
jgi:hypothetical protein